MKLVIRLTVILVVAIITFAIGYYVSPKPDTSKMYTSGDIRKGWMEFSQDSMWVMFDSFKDGDEVKQIVATSNRPDTFDIETYLGRKSVGVPIPRNIDYFSIWMDSNYTRDTTGKAP